MTPPVPPAGDTGPDGEQFADGRGRYRLDSRIATGGMGEVWRATDTLLGRQVAVKLLKHEFADDATFRARFADEAQHAAALDHPGVAAVYDVGEAAPGGGSSTPRPFLVMELVDGEPLSTLLRQGRDGGRAIDRDVLRDLLAQAATAIGAAHAAGIVHRDVKPANLLVTRDRRIKITDFGIARAADAVGITQTGQVMGTPQYLSPEQARGEAATPASDVYALGVVAFECLAGRRPFEADSPVATALAHLQQPVPDLPDDVPADLAAVVRTALAKDPAQRYPNGTAFAAALREPATAVLPGGVAAAALAGGALAGGAFGAAEDGTRVMPAGAEAPPSTLETPVAPTPTKGEGRSKVLLAVVGAIVLALVGLGLVFALRGGGDDTPPPAPETSSTASASESAEPTPTREPSTAAPTPSTEAPTTQAPPTVSIDAANYVGAQVDDVVNQLSALGLDVRRSEITNDGSGAEGEVVGVSPDGEVEVGSSVTVTYLGAPPAPSTPSEPSPSPSETSDDPGNSENGNGGGSDDNGGGNGNGNADGPVVPTPSTTEPSVPPAPAASPAATPAPGATAAPGGEAGTPPGGGAG